jgi:hypothetical protein
MLEGSQETLHRLIKVLEAAQLAKDGIRGNVSQEIKATQSRMEAQLGLMLDDFDQATRPLLADVEAIKRRGAKRPKSLLACDGPAEAAAAVSAGSPPISNRGVRSTPKTKKRGS